MKPILNVKKTSKLIRVIFSYYICSGLKSQQSKKPFAINSTKTFDFSQNSSVPFHRVTFDHSISCVLLIAKTPKKLKEMLYPPQKKAFKKKRK